MQKLIKYFLNNTHLNHLLMVFLIISGIYAYINIPKELFPNMELNKIIVSGGYAGVSSNDMDKLAVRDIEDAINTVSGITEVQSIITPGRFSIILTLDESRDKNEILFKVKDSLANVKQNLPSDMNEVVASLLVISKDLIKLSVASNDISYDKLLNISKEIKSLIMKKDHISEIKIYGESDQKIEILIDQQAIKAYGLNPVSITKAIKNLSYTFPIGEIDDEDEYVFISTINGKNSVDEYLNSTIQIDDKFILLSDIADVKIYYPQDSTLASVNAKDSISLKISKDLSGDGIKMSKELRKYVKTLQKKYQSVDLNLYDDSSIPTQKRLKLITSNLFLGLILIFFTMYFLINKNSAIVVSMGVPFAFIIGLLFIYIMGYSINIISLIGALLVVGIAVDDAVVVSENIQRHIDEGLDPSEAAYIGVKEVLIPVTFATLTTIVAFLPMFMMSGQVGLFIKLIPVVVVAVLVGSIIESFLFLPLHSKTILKKDVKSLDWSVVTSKYNYILHKLILHKKTTLALFFILVPLLTYVSVKNLHFNFMPSYDSSKLYITAKMQQNSNLINTNKKAKEIEKYLYDNKEKYNIKIVSNFTGSRKTLAGDWENGVNMFYITIELFEKEPENFVNLYINPFLDFSFDFEHKDKTRKLSSSQIALQLSDDLKKFEENGEFLEFAVMQRRPGLVKTDVKVDLISKDSALIQKSILRLEKEFHSIKGVTTVIDNVKLGRKEYKLEVNEYGVSLGLNEVELASTLSGYFLGSKKAMSFNEDGVINIVSEFKNKDSLQTLYSFEVPLKDGSSVRLDEVVNFHISQDFEMLEKLDGEIRKSVSVNIDKNLITSSEVLEKINPVLDEIKSSGVKVRLKGEKEKNDQLKADMKKAVFIAMFLILILLLMVFKKIKYALMIISVIPLSLLGAFVGHIILGVNLSMTSMIGMLGLAGVVINDGIIMLDFLNGTKDKDNFFKRATQRFRPIIITSLTTFIGLATLVFFATGQAVIMQPLAISLGFGLLWGTIVNLFYLPALYAMVNRIN